MQDATECEVQNAECGVKLQWGNLLTLLQGRKTYSTLMLTAVLLGGQYLHWWVLPEQLYRGLELLALAFIKAGLTRTNQANNKTETTNGHE